MRYVDLSDSAKERARLWWTVCTADASALHAAAVSAITQELDVLELDLQASLTILDGDVRVRFDGYVAPDQAIRMAGLFGASIPASGFSVRNTETGHALEPESLEGREIVEHLRRLSVAFAREQMVTFLGDVERKLEKSDAEFDSEGRLRSTGMVFESPGGG